MSLNEFVLAFTGVIIGLGVADLLTSLHKLLRAGDRVKWDWLTLLFAAYMMFGLIVFWWWQYGFPGEGQSLTLQAFLPMFIFLAICFLMVASALPDDVPPEGVVLRDFYNATVGYRWGLLSLSLVLNLIEVIWASVRIGRFDWGIVILLPCVFLPLLALRFRAPWFHAFVLLFLFSVSIAGLVMQPIAPG